MEINILFSDNFRSGSLIITFLWLTFHVVTLFISFMIKIKPSISINTLLLHYKEVIVTY